MRTKALIATVAVTAALAVAGTAGAQLVDQNGAEGNTPSIHLSAVDTTTAFTVGVWSFSPGTPIRVDYAIDCFNPANDRQGTTVLSSTDVRYIWIGNPLVGTPWHGWDVCSADVDVSADFGTNPDGSVPTSALTAWLTSQNGR